MTGLVSAAAEWLPDGLLLGSVRLLPVVLLSPLFGMRTLPMPARLVLVAGLAVALVPTSAAADLPMAVLIAREAALGLALGLTLAAPLYAARAAGELWDQCRGVGALRLASPLTDAPVGASGTLLELSVLAAAAELGAHRAVAEIVAESFVWFTPGGSWSAAESLGATAPPEQTTAGLLALTVGLAGPALLAALVIDLALGAAGRVAPPLQLLFLGLPLKALLGAVVLGALLTTLTAEVALRSLDVEGVRPRPQTDITRQHP